MTRQCLMQIEGHIRDAQGIIGDSVGSEHSKEHRFGRYPGARRHYTKIKELYDKATEFVKEAQPYYEKGPERMDSAKFHVALDRLMVGYAHIFQAMQLCQEK